LVNSFKESFLSKNTAIKTGNFLQKTANKKNISVAFKVINVYFMLKCFITINRLLKKTKITDYQKLKVNLNLKDEEKIFLMCRVETRPPNLFGTNRRADHLNGIPTD
jgi:hypothetical protein